MVEGRGLVVVQLVAVGRHDFVTNGHCGRLGVSFSLNIRPAIKDLLYTYRELLFLNLGRLNQAWIHLLLIDFSD